MKILRKGRCVWLVAGILPAVLAAALLAWLSLRGETYQDHSLDWWLTEASSAHQSGPDLRRLETAQRAVRHFGTNALPTLLRRLKAEDSRVKQIAMQLLGHQSIMRVPLTSAEEKHLQASLGYIALGPVASQHLPELIVCLTNDSRSEVRLVAAGALGGIGPGASLAVPALLGALKDSEWRVRFNALSALDTIHPKLDAVLTNLIESLEDSQSPCRASAAEALGNYGAAASAAIPALKRALTNNSAAKSALSRIESKSAAEGEVKIH